MRNFGRSSRLWQSSLFLVLVLCLLLGGSAISYTLDQTELLNELQMISSELNESAKCIENGLNKVVNSLNQQAMRLSRLEERLLRAERKLKQAEAELTISEQDSKNFEEQINVLRISFDDYKKKVELKAHRLRRQRNVAAGGGILALILALIFAIL